MKPTSYVIKIKAGNIFVVEKENLLQKMKELMDAGEEIMLVSSKRNR